MKSPKIDRRNMNMLIKQLEEIIPFYTPEWNFSLQDPDAGSALVMIFLNMFEGVIKRFNRVPEKNFIEFLNMTGIRLEPAEPVSVPVTFYLSEGTKEPVLIKEGTQIAAYSNESNNTVIFETQKNMSLTPAKLVAAYNVSIEKDSIIRIPEFVTADPRTVIRSGTKIFDHEGENLQQHIVYFSHDYLLDLKSRVHLVMEIQNTNKQYQNKLLLEQLQNSEYCSWQYWGELDGEEVWRDLDIIYTEKEELCLGKYHLGQIKSKEINGLNHRFIRCMLKARGLHLFKDLEIDDAKLKVMLIDGTEEDSLRPEIMFYNEMLLANNQFYPFGEIFNIFDCFYISSNEAFTKTGAIITIELKIKIKEKSMMEKKKEERKWKLIMKKTDFTEKQPLKSSISSVQWEYWNGVGWWGLPIYNTKDEIFEKEGSVKIIFRCPKDMHKVYVNNQYCYWIRARISSIRNLYSPDFIYLSPLVEQIRIHYEMTEAISVNKVFTYNNMQYKNYSQELVKCQKPFPLFYSLGENGPYIYLGFDRPLQKGPLSLFFSFYEKLKYRQDTPKMKWEYFRKYGDGCKWEGFGVTDFTEDFERSDVVVFMGMQDLAKKVLFNEELYWIRIVNADGKYEQENVEKPIIKGIYPNTCWCLQTESIQRGILNKVDHQENPTYMLDKTPVLEEEVWIREEEILNDEEIKYLEDAGYVVEVFQDSIGIKDQIWIKWIKVQDFLQSDHFDRHYTLDSVTGRISFGNGIHGMKPPYLEDSNVKVKYKVGGGVEGNVKAFEICHLQTAISHVDQVFNPEPAKGGCNSERVEDAIIRGPKAIVHKDRAITAEDFECLAKQANRSVTKAKCFSSINREGKKQPGCITLVISTVTGGSLNRPSLKDIWNIQDYICSRTADNVVRSGSFFVIEPVYVEISLVVTVAAYDINMAYQVEEDVLSKLNSFLDPYSGNYEGGGWEIGQLPHISMFHSLVKSVDNVNYIEGISLLYRTMKENEFVEISLAHLNQIPFLLVIGGKHQVLVKI